MKKLIPVFAVIVAAVGLSACGSEGPEVKEARKVAAAMEDSRQAGNILNSAVAQKVPCGQIPKIAINPHTGKARFWYSRAADGLLECFNTAGFSRSTEETALLPITRAIVEEILNKKEYYPEYEAVAYTKPPVMQPIVVAPPPTLAPLVLATPLPQLSEGPCCLDR